MLCGLEREDAVNVFDCFDLDNNGSIEYKELSEPHPEKQKDPPQVERGSGHFFLACQRLQRRQASSIGILSHAHTRRSAPPIRTPSLS